MLPGLRFFFAAILLSTSILVFGLGAAALLRSAHDEVASLPARRAPSPTIFTHFEVPQPSLAMLRVNTVAEVAEVGLDRTAPAEIAPADPVAVPTVDQPGSVAEQPTEVAAAPVVVSTLESNAVADVSAVEAAPADVPANSQARLAAEPQAAAEADPVPVSSPVALRVEPAASLASVSVPVATSRVVASLESVTVARENGAAAKATQTAAKKKAQAQRAVRRRRALARARLLRQQQAQEQAPDPFAPFDTATTTTATAATARR